MLVERGFAEPAAPEAPKTVGGMFWDGDSYEAIPGYTEQQEAIAAAGRAPPQPQQPLATNLITLVGPKGEQQSFDSRDPQVKALASQGWVERQNSMFPAAPSGYRYTPTGDLEAIPQGPADPANPNNITGDQRKVSSFAERLAEANTIIDDTESAGASYAETAKSSVPVLGNLLISSDRQKLEQAQRDFVNAQLRRESGATIQDTEFESAKKQYFPQPGDSTAVIEQKRKARKLAIENMKREAGAAAAPSGTSDGGIPRLQDGSPDYANMTDEQLLDYVKKPN
jgi:hypothetical protein